VIPLVTSTRDNCLGTECPSYRDCHVMRARRDAMAADLVVVNHHLFFADLALRDTGVAELLPTVDAAVFDEAHQLVETGVQFLGVQLGTTQADRLRTRSARGGPHAGARPASVARLAAACEHAARDLRLACAGPVARRARRDQAGVGRARVTAALQTALQALAGALQRAVDALADLLASRARLRPPVATRGRTGAARGAFAAPCETEHVRWIDVGPRDARLVAVAARHPRAAGRAARRRRHAPGSSRRPRWATMQR
jgi:ATP-dependent DNA helicase DinG